MKKRDFLKKIWRRVQRIKRNFEFRSYYTPAHFQVDLGGKR